MRPSISARTAFAAAFATIITTLCGPAMAQQPAPAPAPKVQVGVLQCLGGASIGFIVGGVTNLKCVLKVDGVPDDPYVAIIQKVGLDIGITEQTALAWAVFAPVARLAPGDLAGTYDGVTADVAAGLGLGANLLVGGSNRAIALQPASVEGNVGIGVSAGLENLQLRAGQ